MIKIFISFMTMIAVWLIGGLDWLSELLTAHHLANIALVILGIFIASAASQLRLALEKVENILSLYAKYTHPDSEDGNELSDTERKRLLDLFLRELGGLVQELGVGFFPRMGKWVQSGLKAVGFR